jgi:hypothetical protein
MCYMLIINVTHSGNVSPWRKRVAQSENALACKAKMSHSHPKSGTTKISGPTLAAEVLLERNGIEAVRCAKLEI